MLINILIQFKRDCKGFLFSTDLLFSLIIVIVIMGISADLMDLSSNNMQDQVFCSNFEKSVIETTDILIKTPGTPDNWEELNNFQYSSPGLVEINEYDKKIKPGTLSLKKILALKEYMMQYNIFPEYIDSNMVIYPLNPNIPPIIIKNSRIPINTPEIVLVNRTILCDFHYLNCTLQINSTNDNESGFREICSHSEHRTKLNSTNNYKWTCKNFNVTLKNLNSRDYYLINEPVKIRDEKACWSLDKTDCKINEEIKFNNIPLKLNDKIIQLLDNTSQEVFWLHIKSINNPKKSFNTYIVSVPKNTPIDIIKYNYIRPQPCYFVVSAWIKS